MNDALSVVAKKMVLAIGVLLSLLIAGSIVYYRSIAFLPFAFGASLGCGLNVLKIAMLERTVRKTVGIEKKAAVNYVRFQYFLRYLITGLVLTLSAVLPFISLWGAAAGIFTMPPAAFYAKKFIDSPKNANGFSIAKEGD